MIAINATVLDSRPTGLGVVAREIANGVARLDGRVAILASHPEAFSAARVLAVPPWVCDRHRFPIGGVPRFLWEQFRLPGLLKALGARVLLSPNHEAVFFPPCPQVLVIHDLLPLVVPEDFPKLKHFYRHVLPWALRRAAAVIAVSESTKKDLVRFYGLAPEKIDVIYSGIDRGLFQPLPGLAPAAEPYILYVGNQYPYKNLPRLIEAFAGLAQAGFPHALRLAGIVDPRRIGGLRRLVSRLGLQDRVRFLGYVPEQELPGLYAQAQLFVLPSLHEGFGLTAAEAMACGCPAALSRSSSLPEVGGEAACYFDPLDVRDMGARLSEVLGDAPRRAAMARAGLEQSRRFDWEDASRRYLEVLRRAARP